MRLSLIPRTYRFFDLFEESARKLVAGAEMLVDLLDHFENVEMKTARIKDLEHEADDITHEVYRQVYQTFLTPLDREDIVALAQKLDDVMDFIEGSTTAIRIYGITEPTPAARSLADLVRLQCIKVERAVSAHGRTRRGRDTSGVRMTVVAIDGIGGHLGQEIEIRGWVYNLRSSGSIHFVLLRDGTGILQAVAVRQDLPSDVFEAVVLKNA